MFQFTGTAISTAQYCIPARVQVLPAPCVAAMQHQFPAAILDLLGIPCGHRWPIQHRSPRPLQCDQSQAGRVLERPGCTLFVESRISPPGNCPSCAEDSARLDPNPAAHQRPGRRALLLCPRSSARSLKNWYRSWYGGGMTEKCGSGATLL